MEDFSKLKDLNMTTDEVNRLSKALKDESFREMLNDYVKEISDPQNRKTYEDQIKLLEQERGNSIDFIHPEPNRVLKTSLDGKQKCFINICTNEKVRTPWFEPGRGEDGRGGQSWFLPNSATPGRPHRDPKGNTYMIYDVVFHPDTLHMAGKNGRFMDLVDKAAVDAIQDGFKVKLDRNNVRVLKIKYKGVPEPPIIRRSMSDQPKKEKPAHPDPLSFPYPDENKSDTATPPTKSPNSKAPSAAEPQTEMSQSQPQSTSSKEPTTPKYTVKYRSFIDLQDFRCSRDSTRGPRPKEIVITIDLPLLRSAGDADLVLLERRILLESKKPAAYRLELPLAYPVDKDKGEAKFVKQKKQLTLTLPVLPVKEPSLAELFGHPLVSGDDAAEMVNGIRCERGMQTEDTEDGDGEEDTPVHHVCCATEDLETVDSGNGPSLCIENQPTSSLKDNDEVIEQSGDLEEDKEEHNPRLCDESQDQAEAPEPTEINGKTGDTEKNKGEAEDKNLNDKVESEPSSLTSTMEDICGSAAAPAIPSSPDNNNNIIIIDQMEHCSSAHRIEEMEDKPAPAKDKEAKKTVHFSEDVEVAQEKAEEEEEEEEDEDDLPTEQTFQDCDKKPPPPVVLLRETNDDGKEVVISDHSTSAGFTFQNSLLYDLD